MSVFRIHKTENYSVIANYHFKEKGLSLKSKGLLSLMLSLPDTWQYSISGLTKLSKDGKDSVMSALAELEDFGYLKRTRITNDKGQFAGVRYDIFEQPQPKEPISDIQNEDNSNMVETNAEKPTQLNTNSIKDLNNKILDILNTKDTELIALYQEYIELRKSTLSLKGLERLVARAKRLSKGNVRVEKEMLDASIRNNWKDIYLPKETELEYIKNEGLDELRAFYGIE